MTALLLIYLIGALLYLFILIILFLILFSLFKSSSSGAPFIKNDDIVIYEALKLAKINLNEKLVDLGSGDGRVLFLAKDHFNIKEGHGFEISLYPHVLGCFNKLRRQTKNLFFHKKSIFDPSIDLSNYEVIYTYLLPNLLKKLTPLLKQAKEKNINLRIVSPVFEIPGLEYTKKEEIYHKKFNKRIPIYLY